MKKLLILMLVLGVTSVASAALSDFTMTTDGSILYIDGIAGGSCLGYNIVDGGAGPITITVPQTPSITPDGGGGNNAGDLAAAAVMAVGPPYGNALTFTTGFSGVGTDIVDAGEWFQFSVSVTGGPYTVGQVVQSLLVLDAQLQTLGNVDATYIPEPMTIALLGLGGLALLRRRK